jgi:hypothetical protein
MDCVRLTDAELLHCIREGGEPYFSALHELEQRHFHAVRSFASACTVHSTAADDLAYEAWQEALRQRVNGSVSGAVRPCVLSSVLRTASSWTRGHHRAQLNPQLAGWIDANGPVMLGNTATAGFRRPSLVARAYACLSHRSQTIVWHQAVEHDGSALTGRLTGVNPTEVPALTGPAQGELYYSYTQVLQEGVPYECRPYHQWVLAYADTRSAETTRALAPHLERCERCAQVIADLGRLRNDCGSLLSEALLPWGGLEYAAGVLNDGGNNGTQDPRMLGSTQDPWMLGASTPDETATPLHALFPVQPAVPAPQAMPALPAAFQMPESPLPAFPSANQSFGGPSAPGRGRHAAAMSETGAGVRAKGRRRTDLVVKSAAVVGVCAVAAAFAVVGTFDDDEPEPQAKGPSKEQGEGPATPPKATPSSKSPSPSKTREATARPKPTATKTRPTPPKPSPTRPSQPSVAGASVEWLFNDVNSSGVTPDSSENGKPGTLFGSTRPTPTKGGALAFDGNQFVASDGPLVDTSGSFTVSARVKLNRTDVSQTVVSQDASDNSGFSLQYDAEETRWEMRMPKAETDAVEADGDEAVSVFQPKVGDWTHLTGVYDDADDEIRLYVDGRLGETVEHDEDFESEGIFAVGRGLAENRFFQGLDGTVDDVRAFDRAISTSEARTLTRRS